MTDYTYTYIVEKNASKMCQLPNELTHINIICYSINTYIVEPFLLFMVEKIDNCLNFPKLYLPVDDIEREISILLEHYNYIYNGIVCDSMNNYYAVVKIQEQQHKEQSTINVKKYFFVLATEIINNKHSFQNTFSSEMINSFIQNPTFYLLINKKTKYAYKLPDVAYKYIDSDDKNYYLSFQNKKEKFFENCDEYYFFNKSISNSLRHVTIMRYALFTGNKIHFENNQDFILNDYEINDLLKNDKYKTIIISYLNTNDNYPDILVVDYNIFSVLSYVNID
jgi:hypothetical protein